MGIGWRSGAGFALATAAAFALLSGVAHSAPKPDFFKCKEAPGGKCGTIKVPLDRLGTSNEKIKIFFEYYKPTKGGPADEAIVTSGGGPGASATQDQFYSDFLKDQQLTPLLKKRAFVVVDQRGVGKSGALDCPELQHGENPDLYESVENCAEQLGREAQLYGTGDVALDLEAVRKALKIDELNLFGGSYAATDIQAYVTRFPEHVRSVVLDAPLVLVDYDTFFIEGVKAHDRAADLICERSLSCGPEIDTHERLAWLAERVRTDPVEGTALDAQGQEHDVVVDESFLLYFLMWTTQGGFVSLSEIGAAAKALEAGDEAPLLRLAAEHDQSFVFDDGSPKNFSSALNWARYCTDAPFSWDKSAPLAMRQAQFEAARDALPDDTFAPYSVEGWLSPLPDALYGPDPCIRWPAPDGPVEPALPTEDFPADVPALILAGDLDLDTPTAEAEKLQAVWPGSELVEVVNAEHTPATTAQFQCAAKLTQDFMKNLAQGDSSCAEQLDNVSFPARGDFPMTSDDTAPATVGDPSKDESTELDRKVAAAAVASASDGFRRLFSQQRGREGPGLRGGTFEPNGGSDTTAGIKFTDLKFTEDVSVKGTGLYNFNTQAIKANVKVDGPGSEDGKLDIKGVWFGFGPPTTVFKVTGKIDGRKVSLEVPAS